MDEVRLERGKAIAAKKQIRVGPDGAWFVLSQTLPKTKYTVDARGLTCTCPDFDAWQLPCKHVFAVQIFTGHPSPPSKGQKNEDSPMPRPTYSQDWAAYNAAQIHEREHFEQLLKELCAMVTEPKQKMGRPRLPLSDAIYTLASKVYSTMSARRAATELERCVERDLLDGCPHANSISRYMLDPKMTAVLTQLIEISAKPLSVVESHFSPDGTGFSTSTYSRWFDHKYGRDTRKQRWLKAHVMVGSRTNVVTSVVVTESWVNDSTQLPDLLASTAKNFNMKEVSADKAYLGNLNLMAIEAHGAVPFIPFKVDSVLSEHSTSAWSRMWGLFWYQREEFLRRYHQRSNVEATFSMIKRKFGGAVRSKKFESQKNEVLCKFLCHNIVVLIHEMYELGIEPDFHPTSTRQVVH